MQQSVLEQINNAIVQLARISGPTSAAADLNADWQDNVWDGQLRSSGALLPLLWGALQGYHSRYTELYSDLSASERAQLPMPSTIKPTARKVLSEVERQIIEGNMAAAKGAAKAAREGTDIILTVPAKIREFSWSTVIPVLGFGALFFWAMRK